MPEMLFGSTLELKHEASGVALSFNALDALLEWKARKGSARNFMRFLCCATPHRRALTRAAVALPT